MELLTKELLTKEILLKDKSIDISDLTNNDTLLSWNGNEIIESKFMNVIPELVGYVYLVKTETKSVIISEEQGFWLDSGDKLKVKDIVLNDSKVYVLVKNILVSEKVISIERLNESLMVYNIIGSTYRNYFLNDILLHNFDPVDYMTNGMIGCDNIEVGHEVWWEAYTTAQQTENAWINTFDDFLLSMIFNKFLLWDDTDVINEWQSALNDISNKLELQLINKHIFFNSLLEGNSNQFNGPITHGPSGIYGQRTQLGSKTYTILPFVDSPEYANITITQLNTVHNDLVIDYTGKTTFQPEYYYNHKLSFDNFFESYKRFLALSNGIKYPENDEPFDNRNGYKGYYGFIEKVRRAENP
jgi:hypothetical protein